MICDRHATRRGPRALILFQVEEETQLLIVNDASLPAERLYQYRRELLFQEEERLRQSMIRYQNELAGLQGQIEVILLELSFLM